MTCPVKLVRLAARFGAASLVATLLLVSACNTTDLPMEPASQDLGEPLFSTSTAGGMAFGSFDLDVELLGAPYNAAIKLPGPDDIIRLLTNVRSRGGRVMVMLSNLDSFVQNSDRTFNLTKWKTQVARFKNVDFKPYIADGTLIGFLMIDEPEDPSNWGGHRISPATVEEMGRYSKSLWPTLTTFIRGKPTYLASTGMKFRYLDVGWAMYQSWQGDVSTWIKGQVAAAKQADIGVVVGLNVLNGGTSASGIKGTLDDFWAMSASQLRSWGSILMNEPYACAFFNWKYNVTYNARTDIKAAMSTLLQTAQSRSPISCRPASRPSDPGVPPDPTDSTPPSLPGQTTSRPLVYGSFDLDNAVLGSPYNASVRLPGPTDIVRLLSGAKAKRGRVVVQLSGQNKAVQNTDGTFSLTKWKRQIDRFRGISVSSYLTDGTLMGHLLISRPSDASTWGGKKISPATLEAMAQYSKQIWPRLTTFVLSDPTYLRSATVTYRYLDAGWIMYASWKGDARTWLTAQVAAAKAEHLGLMVGLDVLNGGTKASGIPGRTSGRYAMSATQLRTWGSTLLSEPYACGVFNWRYNAVYNGRTDIRSAMSDLALKTKAHVRTTCSPLKP
jgi:hypothetical protein